MGTYLPGIKREEKKKRGDVSIRRLIGSKKKNGVSDQGSTRLEKCVVLVGVGERERALK